MGIAAATDGPAYRRATIRPTRREAAIATTATAMPAKMSMK
jgi:hypothetical protein